MRILSGIQPSGTLHIGNYLGMIKPMTDYQKKGDLFCFVADLHSLTTVNDREKLAGNIRSAIIDLLALGIDPDKSVFWVQSDVPEVTELTWYLNTVTPVGLLERCHSYKDKISKGISASNGLFSYPVLMAADILIYESNIVPVGRDQKQHVEVTRDIALKFNRLYGEVFTIPEAEIKDNAALIPGTDGQKMSKSYDNTIEIFSGEKALKKKVMNIVTDSKPVEAPKDPEKNNVYAIYRLFAPEDKSGVMYEKLKAGGYGYGEAKKELYSFLMDYFGPFRKEREKLCRDTGYVDEIRLKGAQKAKEKCSVVLEKVRNAVGVGFK